MRPILILTAVLFPQLTAAQSKTVSLVDAPKWESLGASSLSSDGKWIAYQIARGSGENELRYRLLREDSTRVVKMADQANFSRTANWLAYRITVTEAERTRLVRQNQPVRDKIGLVDLRSGQAVTIDDVQSYSFNYPGTHLTYRKYAPTGRRSRGADVVVRNLASGIEMLFGNVAEYAWQDRGTMLALAIEGETQAGNGVQLYDPATGALRVLDSQQTRYSGLTWRRKSDDLVVMRARVDTAFSDTAQTVLAWRGLGSPKPQSFTLAGAAGTRVVTYRRPRWSDDGSMIFVGVKKREPKLLAKAAADSADRPGIEVWHYRDVRPQYAQKLNVARERERNALTAWTLATGKLQQLSDERADAILLEGQKTAILMDDQPYEFDGMFGRPSYDLHRIDVTTGTRTALATKVPFGIGSSSPTGRYAAFIKEGQWWVQDLTAATTTRISVAITGPILDEDDDHPVHHRRAWGVAGWTSNDRSLLVYDKYDIWEVTPDGSQAKRLTRGSEDQITYRYLRLDPEQTTIDLSQPQYLTMSHERTKQSGIACLSPKGVEKLVFVDAAIGGLRKAENAEVFVYTRQSYQDSPDLFVGGAALADAKQVSNTNPFQPEYAWGKAELIEYANGRGEPTQAILYYPANYQAGRQYPMVVYIYERLTNGLHQYTVPSDRQQYNTTNFVQDGYFVLRPDITYVPREPGKSTIESVVPAINKTVSMGLVDARRVGVFGHSWGGYGSAFLATHTNGVFAAAIAGAALTDLISFYGYSSDNSGMPEHGHFEVGQERMQVSLWQDPEAYIRNSPVFTVDKMTTPLLIEHGDRDGNVDFGQGVELYNAARRNGKNVVMIVYNGENHGLARKPNQQDYVKKQLEWFGHYLKGNPAPKWITDGVPYIQR
ncbi:MAG: prolyl oligopeptidase family serine peptidase [Gemmatimonadota bacterium]